MSNSTNYVFVLDAKKKPLAPCKPAMARSLLKAGKAKVFKRYPFTIILNKLVALENQDLQLKIDPGSKQTGFALVTQSIDAACIGEVEKLTMLTSQPLVVTAMGHGCRQMVQMDKYGFPRIGYKAKKPDIMNVVKGKNAGLKGVRIKTVRSKGNFDIRQGDKILSVSRNHIQPVHRRDGYNYSF